jgi:hypothetical protein
MGFLVGKVALEKDILLAVQYLINSAIFYRSSVIRRMDKRPKANSHIPCRSYAAPMPRFAVTLRGRFQNGMVVAWHGNGRARHGMCESNTAGLCKSNGKDSLNP